MKDVIFLSHVLRKDIPLYGGSGEIRIQPDKSISQGDSCNTSIIQMPGHAGTHVDAPLHFFDSGKSIETFSAKEWIFDNPWVIDVNIQPGELIQPENISEFKIKKNADFIIFRTNFENFRDQEIYWQENPGLAPELADFLFTKSPGLRAVGMDFISISSFKHRMEGRRAHQDFLKRNVLIFEDMKLGELREKSGLEKIVALPLRFEHSDGVPVTIIGFVAQEESVL